MLDLGWQRLLTQNNSSSKQRNAVRAAVKNIPVIACLPIFVVAGEEAPNISTTRKCWCCTLSSYSAYNHNIKDIYVGIDWCITNVPGLIERLVFDTKEASSNG